MSLQSTLDELKILAKDKRIRKQSPRLYKLIKEQIKVMGELTRNEAEINRLEAIIKRTRTRQSELAVIIEKELWKWQMRN